MKANDVGCLLPHLEEGGDSVIICSNSCSSSIQ